MSKEGGKLPTYKVYFWMVEESKLKVEKGSKSISKKKETPLMKQFNQIKAKHPDAILLFRVGDFYETFGEDAIKTSRAIGITLTKRSNGSASAIELAGFPHHALDTYLPKLVRAGFRVAICEQLEDPKMTKKIVKRGVTELITPGVALRDDILDHNKNNYLASLSLHKDELGISFCDISTGELLVAEGGWSYIEKLLQSFSPSEIILAKPSVKAFKEKFAEQYYLYPIDDWVFGYDYNYDKLKEHFKTNSLKGFSIDEMSLGISAAGSILHYLGEAEHNRLDHINTVQRIYQDEYVWLDRFTIRNLELIHSVNPGAVPLADILDKTISPMGSRLLKKWIILPLKDSHKISSRQKVVEAFIKHPEMADAVRSEIKVIGDLERLSTKVSMLRVNPREVEQLNRALLALPKIKEKLASSSSVRLKEIADQINPCIVLSDRISKELKEDLPVALHKGNVIADGVSSELDELRLIASTGKKYLIDIQQREADKTGITSLKIGFNNVFGYYLEVRNTHKSKVPEEWIRKQTLTNAERYITQELKEYEEKIVSAESQIKVLEADLFEKLVYAITDYIAAIKINAQLIATVDCLLSFAAVAVRHNYTKPNINDSQVLDIKQGRHPVIEQQLDLGEAYVPNDLYLDNESQQIMIITGPNMAGKSAVLRQTALIVLMAQMGSFVPAESAEIGWVDKVFTRVGASDNISSGESTFMVEMNETASIMNNLSERSLLILDEIGRGTSTYDGISIAWSLAQFLHNRKGMRPKTLFATHYHELTELSEKYERIKNFSISTKLIGNKVVFLRKLIPEGAKHSFGIHVARMAGMPKEILDSANKILVELEKKNVNSEIETKLKNVPKDEFQLNIFQMDDPEILRVKDILHQLDINTLTPVEALMKLNEIKDIMKG